MAATDKNRLRTNETAGGNQSGALVEVPDMTHVMAKPQRCSLVNLTSGEEMPAFFNPQQLTERVQVNYARHNVPGMSHQPLQYVSTGNRTLPAVDFYLDKIMSLDRGVTNFDIMDFRNFMHALTLPPGVSVTQMKAGMI